MGHVSCRAAYVAGLITAVIEYVSGCSRCSANVTITVAVIIERVSDLSVRAANVTVDIARVCINVICGCSVCRANVTVGIAIVGVCVVVYLALCFANVTVSVAYVGIYVGDLSHIAANVTCGIAIIVIRVGDLSCAVANVADLIAVVCIYVSFRLAFGTAYVTNGVTREAVHVICGCANCFTNITFRIAGVVVRMSDLTNETAFAFSVAGVFVDVFFAGDSNRNLCLY